MPELPDIVTYLRALEPRVLGRPISRVALRTPFLLRTVDPPLAAVVGAPVRALSRIGKRLVFHFDDELAMVIHLMIAGRLRWRPPGPKVPVTITLASFDFPDGTLHLTEAGSKRRASLHVVRGAGALAGFDRGGLEPLAISREQFAGRLRSENHTLKRSLTDPRLFSGIGNAFSDEILHRARLSPLQLSTRLTDDEASALHAATRSVLDEWTERLTREVGDGFPEKVTAFRDGFAVHGKYGQPCPDCGAPVQRIRYADNETNYCARCQTNGRRLADRALSRLLGEDWPRSIDELD